MSDPTPDPTPETPEPQPPEQVIGTHTVGDTEGGDGREVTGNPDIDRPDKRKEHDPY